MKQISITYLEKSSQVAIMKTKLNTNLFEDRFDLLFLKCKSFKLSSFFMVLWFCHGQLLDCSAQKRHLFSNDFKNFLLSIRT